MSASNIETRFRRDLIHETVYIAASAVVRGNVHLSQNSSIWFGAVVRGDTEEVRVGARSNIQDQCVLHADPGFPCELGDDVTLGHGAIVHGAKIGNGAMIGIRATVLNGATVGEGALVAAGALVPEGAAVPAGTLVMGIPAKVVRPLDEADRQRMAHASEHYVAAASRYRESESDVGH